MPTIPLPTLSPDQDRLSATNPQSSTTDMPNIDEPSSMKRKDRRSAKRIADYIRNQYEEGLRLRAPHARKWAQVEAIMNGIHYYTFRNGVIQRKAPPRDRRDIRAVDPLMKPYYRWELGRLAANQYGVFTRPTIGAGQSAFYRADRAEGVMRNWLDEAGVDGAFKDESNQHILYYGRSGFYWHDDPLNQTVALRSIAGPEIFPIPYTARNERETSGLLIATFVTGEWLEAQDEKMRRQFKGQPFRKMVDKASARDTRMLFGGNRSASDDGAMAMVVWMKRTSTNEAGEWMFLLDDELYRYRSGMDEKGESLALPNGRVPVELVDYIKKPDSFFAEGFLEGLIYAQGEANRQLSIAVRTTARNKALTFFDSSTIDQKDIGSSDTGLVPLYRGFEGTRIPAIHFPAQSIGRDIGSMLALSHESARRSAGYESDILFGQSEGRVEGGPATSLLNQNAQTPLVSTVNRIKTALGRIYPEVFKMLGDSWPKEKHFAVAGPLNYFRTYTIERDEFSDMKGVRFSVTPLMPGGVNSQLQLLFNLRTMQSPDGKFELSSREFRRALRDLNALPQGIQVYDEKEERIETRIALIINDGKRPGTLPAGMGDAATDGAQAVEDHRLAVELTRNAVLDPAFSSYERDVQSALLKELTFHHQRTIGATKHPDQFDDDIEAADAALMENYLSAAEADLETDEGTFTVDGIPIGA